MSESHVSCKILVAFFAHVSKYFFIMGSFNSEKRNSTNLGYKCFTDRLFLNKK